MRDISWLAEPLLVSQIVLFGVNKCMQPLLFNRLNTELNPICHLLALLGVHHIFHISVLRVNSLFPKYIILQTHLVPFLGL